MLSNPLVSVFTITDEMRDAYFENARQSVELSRGFAEACGATDDFWDAIEDEPTSSEEAVKNEFT